MEEKSKRKIEETMTDNSDMKKSNKCYKFKRCNQFSIRKNWKFWIINEFINIINRIFDLIQNKKEIYRR